MSGFDEDFNGGVRLLFEEADGIINRRRSEFIFKFKVNPTYIKLPKWFYDIVKEACRNLFGEDKKEIEKETYYGMKPCPTIAIGRLDQIEVF